MKKTNIEKLEKTVKKAFKLILKIQEENFNNKWKRILEASKKTVPEIKEKNTEFNGHIKNMMSDDIMHFKGSVDKIPKGWIIYDFKPKSLFQEIWDEMKPKHIMNALDEQMTDLGYSVCNKNEKEINTGSFDLKYSSDNSKLISVEVGGIPVDFTQEGSVITVIYPDLFKKDK